MKTQWMTLLQFLLPILVPLVLSQAKKLLGDKYNYLIPISAPVLAAVADWVQSLASGSSLGPTQAALLGAVGVCLREIIDQIRQSLPAGSTFAKQVIAWFVIGSIAVLGLSACSTASGQIKTQQALHATAEALKTLGRSYIAAGPIMDQAKKSGLIDESVYGPWRTFSNGFQTWYPQTITLWEAAVASNDQVTQGNLEAAINTMAIQLGKLTSDVIAKVVKPKTELDLGRLCRTQFTGQALTYCLGRS
jgi:hypothetical protein